MNLTPFSLLIKLVTCSFQFKLKKIFNKKKVILSKRWAKCNCFKGNYNTHKLVSLKLLSNI